MPAPQVSEYKYSGTCKDDVDELHPIGSPGSCYLAAIFWSLTTLTTIGCAPVAPPAAAQRQEYSRTIPLGL